MKVDDSVKKPAGAVTTPTQTRTGKGVSKAGASSVSSTSSGDSNVQLSAQVQSLSGSSEVFDTNKVEEIKAAIAGGQFHVNPEKVASGLINNVADLLQTQNS